MIDHRDFVDAVNRRNERMFKKLLFRCKCHIWLDRALTLIRL